MSFLFFSFRPSGHAHDGHRPPLDDPGPGRLNPCSLLHVARGRCGSEQRNRAPSRFLSTLERGRQGSSPAIHHFCAHDLGCGRAARRRANNDGAGQAPSGCVDGTRTHVLVGVHPATTSHLQNISAPSRRWRLHAERGQRGGGVPTWHQASRPLWHRGQRRGTGRQSPVERLGHRRVSQERR